VREHFSERELVDLTLAVVAINGWNRLAISFRPAVASISRPRPCEWHRSRADGVLAGDWKRRRAHFTAAGAASLRGAEASPLTTCADSFIIRALHEMRCEIVTGEGLTGRLKWFIL
jgi:hypothetical protein